MKIQSNEKIETLKNNVKGQIVLPDDLGKASLDELGKKWG